MSRPSDGRPSRHRRRLAPEQRRILTIVVGFTLVCLAFVVAVLVAGGHSSGPTGPTGSEPFPIDRALDISDTIVHSGPVCYADLTDEGTRPFCLDLVDGHLAALRAITVESLANDEPCAVSPDQATRTLVDCDDRPVDPHDLQQFRVLISSDDNPVLSVDLRELLPPGPVGAPLQEPEPETTSETTTSSSEG